MATPRTDSAGSPAACLVARLAARGWRLALAESCTGGLVAARITAVPGASAVFRGGIVAYHNEIKRDLLGVPPATLAAAGAVSADTALAMAHGARQRLRADLAAAVTGIAGPGGGTAEKPVGLVCVAVDGPPGARVERHVFAGRREDIRDQACEAVLRMLLEQVPADGHPGRDARGPAG
jgi:PncC family amidohydrolase